MPASFAAVADAEADRRERVHDVGRDVRSTASPGCSPSNVTVPIITTTTATVPGTGSSFGSPASGGRTPTTRSRVSNGLIREKKLK